jgi:hypothetical protein
VNGERVHAARKFGCQRRIDQAMPFQPALSGEGLRYDIDPEVALAPGPMAGVARMLLGFIDDPQAFRAESLGQLSYDQVFDAHGVALTHGRALASTGGASRRNESKPFVKLAAGSIPSA